MRVGFVACAERRVDDPLPVDEEVGGFPAPAPAPAALAEPELRLEERELILVLLLGALVVPEKTVVARFWAKTTRQSLPKSGRCRDGFGTPSKKIPENKSGSNITLARRPSRQGLYGGFTGVSQCCGSNGE